MEKLPRPQENSKNSFGQTYSIRYIFWKFLGSRKPVNFGQAAKKYQLSKFWNGLMSQCPKEPWKLSWDIGTLGHLGTLIVWPNHRRMRDVLGLNFVILPLNSFNLGSKMFYSMRGIYWYPYIEIQGLKSGQNPCFELMSQCPTGPWILIWDIGTLGHLGTLIGWPPPTMRYVLNFVSFSRKFNKYGL